MTDASSTDRPHSSGTTSSFGFRDVDAKAKVGMVRE
ncbi:MAG: bifunctional demethylmenaquinone methyltransferase/2-methoxy-6-polyprenyl-1,4-benzoquinol methylase, partial [Hyphomicrobiales bacterium]